jgi:hypothetical protein
MRTTSERLRSFAQAIYHYCFVRFHDPYTQQEILRALIGHVGSSSTSEVDAALDTLVELCRQPQALRQYASYFDTSMIETLNESQARKGFSVLGSLCFDSVC